MIYINEAKGEIKVVGSHSDLVTDLGVAIKNVKEALISSITDEDAVVTLLTDIFEISVASEEKRKEIYTSKFEKLLNSIKNDMEEFAKNIEKENVSDECSDTDRKAD